MENSRAEYVGAFYMRTIYLYTCGPLKTLPRNGGKIKIALYTNGNNNRYNVSKNCRYKQYIMTKYYV